MIQLYIYKQSESFVNFCYCCYDEATLIGYCVLLKLPGCIRVWFVLKRPICCATTNMLGGVLAVVPLTKAVRSYSRSEYVVAIFTRGLKCTRLLLCPPDVAGSATPSERSLTLLILVDDDDRRLELAL